VRRTYHAGYPRAPGGVISRAPWIAPQEAAAVTIVLPYSRRTRAVIDPGRKETIMGTNESKTVHRVGRRFDAQR
jgi:hypothetical protein